RLFGGGRRGHVDPRRLLGFVEPAARVGDVGVPGQVLGRQEIFGGPTGPAVVVASGGGESVGEGGVRPPVPFDHRLLGGGESVCGGAVARATVRARRRVGVVADRADRGVDGPSFGPPGVGEHFRQDRKSVV